ncbi:MAG: protease modulator HflC [Proteobacteria bacterium]|nr:protease modulator HflC [Pseudomonadota bacterium]
MGRKFGTLVIVILVVLVGLNTAFYIVDQTEQAIVVQLGKPVSGIQNPGLHWKIPFIQDVILFESRLLDYDARPEEILTEDKKNLVVDNYAKWKIIDPLKFYMTVRNVQGALSRLDDIIYAELRVELGKFKMIEIIAKNRGAIMKAVTERSDERARDYGISVVDVRIKRADLPPENQRAVFGRMRTERERQAKKYRSEGEEAALKIRAEADRKRTVILAEAYRESQDQRGQGDAASTKIYARAYNRDPEFFAFLRSLESYEKAMKEETTVILSPQDEFMRYMNQSGAKLKPE